jgi:hypothetical protein
LYQALMADARFHDLLLTFDTDLADIARAGRCVICRSAVHSGNYRRKLRGPFARLLGEEHRWRFSLCCSRSGCRKRKKPPSLRFLGPKAYLGAMRLLSSTRLDSHVLLTVVLAGDRRLIERFRTDEFLPLASRMRVRLALERVKPEELRDVLKHALLKAGAAQLMTPELIDVLCDHAQGNLRALMNMAGELLSLAAERQARQIDEKLFLEAYAPPASADLKTARGRRR